MKNVRLIGCLLMTVIGSGPLMAASTLVSNECGANPIISLLDVNERIIEDFSEGKMKDCILECPEGACIPLKLSLKGDFLRLESAASTSIYMKVLNTCYIRCEEKECFLFSIDRQQWKGFSEFFTGELRVSVSAQSGGPVAGLMLELNRRAS
jgi:hypothetical protein